MVMIQMPAYKLPETYTQKYITKSIQNRLQNCNFKKQELMKQYVEYMQNFNALNLLQGMFSIL